MAVRPTTSSTICSILENASSSSHQLEKALKELDEDTSRGATDGCCSRLIYGPGRQRIKLITLLTVPCLILTVTILYFMSESITARENTQLEADVIEQSVFVGRLIHILQKERDQSVLYASSIGPQTKMFLLQRYMETDDLLGETWTSKLDSKGRPQYDNSAVFLDYLSNHRRNLDINKPTIFEGMEFYTEAINVFISWLINSLSESRYTGLWKELVAYQKVISCKEDLGLERALGVFFFSNGGFDDITLYTWYAKQVNIFRNRYNTAIQYSPLVEKFSSYNLSVNGQELVFIIRKYRTQIENRRISQPSVEDATVWYDSMTLYMEQLFDIQQDIQAGLRKGTKSISNTKLAGVIASSFMLFIILILFPILIRSVINITSNIQNYAVILVQKNNELVKEKQRTNNLLYQMLPKVVAVQLKSGKTVNAEFHKDVTIFFSDIAGFTRMTRECTPMNLVNILNDIYSLFDERISMYKVYKVETIGDSYMVTSGLPERNPQHAQEIADMALDLLESCSELELSDLPGKKVNIRIGLHSGPVMAGVVGSKLPRYCVFGDTVNTASRIETNGHANKIHISYKTYRLLNKTKKFVMPCRGEMDIKGKGKMKTYWLEGHLQQGYMNNDNSTLALVEDMPRMGNNQEAIQEGPDSASMIVCNSQRSPSRLITYDELEEKFDNSAGSPVPIINLVEGHHF